MNKKHPKKCPGCGYLLTKKTKQAEGVSSCEKCGSVWLLLLLRKEEKNV